MIFAKMSNHTACYLTVEFLTIANSDINGHFKESTYIHKISVLGWFYDVSLRRVCGRFP